MLAEAGLGQQENRREPGTKACQKPDSSKISAILNAAILKADAGFV
jgi:hypothetical protein